MKDYTPIISKIDTTNLVTFDNLKDCVKYLDVNCTDNIESSKVIIGSMVAKDITNIRGQMIEGDELVYIISPQWTWDCLAGSAGYGILRNNEIIFNKMLIMS